VHRKWLVFALLLGAAGGGRVIAESRQERAENKKKERLGELTRELRKLNGLTAPSAEQAFLHQRASALLGRAKELPAGSHEFDRVRRAVEDLLEASDEISKARQAPRGNEEDDQEETARRLERTYFRIQQGDYFARLSGELDGGDYVRHARRLYQQSRSAYDAGEWRKARRLAEASSEIIGALERLAQARVRIPEPPRIE
jgi:hypothetical protein